MICGKLLYAALIVVMVLFFILYRGNLSYELLIFTLILPVLLFVSTIWMKRKLKLTLLHSKEPILKGKPYQWVIEVQNPTFFSSPLAQITLEYSNSLSEKPQELTVQFPIMPHNTQRLRLSFHAVTCGMMEMQLKKLVFYDPIRLFRRNIKLSARDHIVLMPSPIVTLPVEWPPTPQPDADSSEYSKTKSGDDPSEIFDLHTYREGDLVSRIHWKLSSKLDNLMVKEYSLPLSTGCLLLADYRHTGGQPESALRIDTMLSAMSAAAAQLSDEGSRFAMTAYHPQNGFQASELFAALPDAVHWLRQIVRTAPVPLAERPLLLHAFQTFLSASHPYERILIFTPQLDDPLKELLLSLPNPERFIIFSVISAEDANACAEAFDHTMRCIPVLMEQTEPPAFLQNDSNEEPDDDAEELVEGGAEP